mmetsp:Transcript_11613/g.28714  ORF Transcript_11613/g.28714 Transcript_11613/m.28714 type:complete len:124 (+) Transcript_11613:292-663(+)
MATEKEKAKAVAVAQELVAAVDVAFSMDRIPVSTASALAIPVIDALILRPRALTVEVATNLSSVQEGVAALHVMPSLIMRSELYCAKLSMHPRSGRQVRHSKRPHSRTTATLCVHLRTKLPPI